jgi:RND superfamily putative drug exporter
MGDRVGKGRRGDRRKRTNDGRALSQRWVGVIQRRPGLSALAATALLLALAAPALDLRLAISGASTDQASTTTRRAYDQLSRGFGPGFNGPLVVAMHLPKPSSATVARVSATLRATPGVASVAPAELSPNGETASIVAIPTSAPQSGQTSALVGHLRNDVLPRALTGTGAQAHVGGFTARTVDVTKRLSDKLPLFIAIVIALSALLLFVVFRSLLIPLQGALMNFLSIGASLGILQALFERGWLAGTFGLQRSPIEPFMPVILFAIVFGLSMDYEVFLISRIHEEWQQHRDASAAVRNGLARTSRVITAAAAVMIAVFASFAASGDHILELFGIGLASAILLDALVIRLMLLPAVLELLGQATWKLPRWLDRRLPHLAIEQPEQPESIDAEPALEAA